MGDLVTTSMPGRPGLLRCAHCHGVLFASRSRLPRIWAGEDEPWCDDCIAPALHACAGRRRHRPSSSLPPIEPATPRRADT